VTSRARWPKTCASNVLLAVRIALGIGFAIDAFVALLSLFAQGLIEPLLDLPVKDPALMTIAGGEFAVVACVYALAFRDPRRWRMLLWICALDQLAAVVLPALAIAHGAIPATFKTVGPIPLQALLALILAAGANAGNRARPA
jgi:hypothetical protein